MGPLLLKQSNLIIRQSKAQPSIHTQWVFILCIFAFGVSECSVVYANSGHHFLFHHIL